MNRLLVSTLFFSVLFSIWQALSQLNIWSDYLLPSPFQVGTYLVESILDGTLIEACYVTIKRLLGGYIVSVFIGIPIGLLNARFQFFEDTIGVIALGLQALPSICWAPLALLWFGQTEMAMFFIILMGSTWSIALATDAGVRHVPPIYIRAARTMGSKGLHLWFKVLLPAALPYIVTGMKLGWAFAWRSLMAAEVYVTIATGLGLGQLLHVARELGAMDAVTGVMLVIIMIGLTVNRIFFSPLETFLHQRWGTNNAY